MEFKAIRLYEIPGEGVQTENGQLCKLLCSNISWALRADC
jgi:hypothetical protein